MTEACVIGARGYLGRETVRILCGHPDIETIRPVSRSETGKPFGAAVPAFRHRDDLRFAPAEAAHDADVVFLATPGGKAKEYVADAPAGQRVIDLSRDHRLQAMTDRADGGWHYGLADLHPADAETRRIANPGCYPTASLLAAAPALQQGLVGDGPIIADGKSGASGAGVSPSQAMHYPEANEAVRAYKVDGHDHQEEIEQAAADLDGAQDPARSRPRRPVRFTPHLVPQTRGLLSTVYLPAHPDATSDQLQEAYEETYAEAPFVHMVEEPDTGHVRGSNHAEVAVHLDSHAGLLVARCAIDNLQKGGSGTAVQNMNDALGFPTTRGLEALGASP